MTDFGERIESIRGRSDRCTITFSNGRKLHCYGELLVDGFWIYKSSLNLTPDEIDRVIEMIEESAKETKNSLKIVIE